MTRANMSIHDIITDAVSQAMQTILPNVQRQIAQMAAKEKDKKRAVQRGRKGARRLRRRARARSVDLTKWVADRRARRVPIFVIEMTGGIDTKKKIVAKYGEGATFEKGKPVPPAVASQRSAPAREAVAARVVKARPPMIRKAATK
jgi:hypothetical protein